MTHITEADGSSGLNLHSAEVARGERFEFGENWRRFLDSLNEARILDAEHSLREMLECSTLAGRSFLDAGSGSGLFSLAARRLGARVHSFDYDPRSVACTSELRRRYFADDPQWTIHERSVLDTQYLRSLGSFDVVYCWGVLHHTGQMWQGLENIIAPVSSGGKLFLAIYNDMGTRSLRWRWVKRTYNRLPRGLRIPFMLIVAAPHEGKEIVRLLLAGRIREYLQTWTQDSSRRGMSRWRDIVDWVGGYPYEVAKPEEIFDFYRARGFTLQRMICGGVGLGCNEFVFLRESRED